MGRPLGRRNPGYESRRRAIAQRVLQRLARPEGAKASLRELAQAAGVSVSTLRHYFGDRQGALQAAIDEVGALGEPWQRVAATDRLDQPVGESLAWFLRLFVTGWQNGVGAMMGESMSAGTGDEVLGRATVDRVFEPTLQAIEARLAHHQRAGEIRSDADLRHAALSLFGPVFAALLHQDTLSGEQCRALDVLAFVDEHVERFVGGWSPSAGP